MDQKEKSMIEIRNEVMDEVNYERSYECLGKTYSKTELLYLLSWIKNMKQKQDK